MKSICTLLWSFLILTSFSGGSELNTIEDYKDGEFLKYRVHYMGITAGYASLQLKEKNYNNQRHFHAIGKGWTTGATKFFYKVNDRYETYFNKDTQLPSKFIRKVNEGGYIKDKELDFDQKKQFVTVNNKKYNTQKTYQLPGKVQDMLSSFYYLRKMNHQTFTVGSVKKIDVFMDEEIFPFKVKVLEKVTLKTDFGKVKAIKLRPYVQSGRVFKEDESLTIWVTDDENLIPILVKAELVVGSIKAELQSFKNLKSKIKVYL